MTQADPYAGIATLEPVDKKDPYEGIAAIDPSGDGALDLSKLTSPKDVQAELDKIATPEGKTAWLNEWARQRISSEGVHNVATRLFAKGTPVGPWLDEIGSGLNSAIHTISGGRAGMPYDQAHALEEARDAETERISSEQPKVGHLPLIGDITTGSLIKGAGGVASAAAASPIAPLRLMEGEAVVPSVVNYGATGAAAGGIAGTGEGEGLERLKNGGVGAGAGLVIGGFAPVAGRALAAPYRAVRDRMRALPSELDEFSRPEIERVARAVRDDRVPGRYDELSTQLGPEGMIADMGPNLQRQAGNLTTQPGRAQERVITALNDRNDMAADRIRGDLDQAFGPQQNVIALERQRTNAANTAARPHYEAFENAEIPMTEELHGALQEARHWGAVQEGIKMARGQSIMPRAINRLEPDAMTPMTGLPNQVTDLVPSGRELDYVKRALDRKANEAFEKGDTHLGDIINQTARRLTTEIDRILSPDNPAGSVYARARGAAAEGKQFSEGLRDGSGVFSRPKTHHPDQVEDDLYDASVPYSDGYFAGARADIGNMMDEAATQFGSTGDRAARKGLWSRNSERRIQQLTDVPRAQRVLNRRDAESTFAQTRNVAISGSDTRARMAAGKEFPNPVDQNQGPRVSDVTLTGIPLKILQKAIGAVTRESTNEALERMADNAARILTATGATRDQYFRGLARHLEQRGISAEQGVQIAGAVEALMLGSVPSAVGAATSDGGR